MCIFASKMTQQIDKLHAGSRTNDPKIGGLCAFIIERRKSLNLSQEKVADLLDMSRRTYQRKEDSGEFTLVELEGLAKALGFRVQFSHTFTFV